MEIKGKVALVTGGAIRIGRAVSEALAKKGAKLAIHYHTSEKEARTLSAPLGAKIFQADLSKCSEIEELVESVEKKLGPIQILVNNAAVFEPTPFLEINEGHFDKHITVNLKAPFLLSQKVARSMLKEKLGKIINIADYTYLKPYRGYLPYSVSKAGLIGLTKCLAKELAPFIQVNAVALGLTLPPASFTEEQNKSNAEKTLLKRWGDPKEIANAVCFLIEGTDYATGSVLEIEGGRLLV